MSQFIIYTVVKSQTKTIPKLDLFLDCAVELFCEKGKNLQLDSMAYPSNRFTTSLSSLTSCLSSTSASSHIVSANNPTG